MLLYLSQELYSTDPRDKVFGLIGLLEGQVGDVSYLRPDYSKGVVDVYTDITVYVLWHLGSFRIPEFLDDRFRNTTRFSGLPSWITDWSQNTIKTDFQDENFDAGVRHKGVGLEMTISEERKLFAVKAKVIGEISQLVYPRLFTGRNRQR